VKTIVKSRALPTATKKLKKPFLVYFAEHKWLYLLMLPGLAAVFVFSYIPMYGVVIAFKDFDVVKGIFDSPWNNCAHFVHLFRSKDFYTVLRNSLLISLYRLLWGFPVPILLTVMLDDLRNIRFKKTVQTIIYLPYFVSWVVLGGMIMTMLSGSLGQVLASIGLKNLLQDERYFRTVLVVSDIWKESGWGTIIYLAAITNISRELYEAAILDGAGQIRRIWHITLPGIMSTVVVMLVLRLGNVLRNGFEQIFMLYNPMVLDVADVFETYTYRIGIQSGRFGYASAVGLFQALIGLILIFSSNMFAKKYGEGGLF
jgi:putative aldouronate transport system permease protein